MKFYLARYIKYAAKLNAALAANFAGIIIISFLLSRRRPGTISPGHYVYAHP